MLELPRDDFPGPWDGRSVAAICRVHWSVEKEPAMQIMPGLLYEMLVKLAAIRILRAAARTAENAVA